MFWETTIPPLIIFNVKHENNDYNIGTRVGLDFLKARFLFGDFFGRGKKIGEKTDFSKMLSAIFFRHVFWSEAYR